MSLLESLGRDLRVAFRGLVKDAGFTIVAITTLGLGVGSAAAVFSLFNQLILQPLPGVPNSSAAAHLRFDTPASDRTNRGVAIFEFDELRRQATLLDGFASYRPWASAASVGGSSPVQVFGSAVYGDFFEVLGTTPAAGRLLTAADTQLGSDPSIAVISQRLAGILFPDDPSPVGRTIDFERHSVTVVGVTGGGFAGHERSDQSFDMWLPLPALMPFFDLESDEDLRRDAPSHSQFLILPSPGASFEAADAQLRSILSAMAPTSSRELDQFVPRISPGLDVALAARERTAGSVRLMAIAASLLLLAACANVANLLVIRDLGRRSVTAVRRAMGASSGRVARLLLTESLLLGVGGAVFGLGIAWATTLVFRGQRLPSLPELSGFQVDWRVISFLVAAAVGTTLLFGAGPAIVAGASRLRLGMESRAGHSAQASRIRAGLSAVQVGLTLSILVGTLLMGRTLNRLYSLDTGLDVERLAAVHVNISAFATREEIYDAQARLIAAAERIPGIERAAAGAFTPHGIQLGLGGITRPDDPNGEPIQTSFLPMTVGYLELTDWEIIDGESAPVFERASNGLPNALLTESLATALFAPSRAVGQTLDLGSIGQFRIAGVAEDYRSHQSPTVPLNAVIVDYANSPPGFLAMSLLVESNDFTPAVNAAIREAVQSTFSGTTFVGPTPYDERIDEIHAEPRALRNLFAILSGFAVAVSGVGLYGLVSFSVASRRRELGVRTAIGASPSRLARLVLSQGGQIVAGGAVFGVAVAYAVGRLLEARLFGVAALDPASFALATSLVVLVGLTATAIPAYRAARTDPARALRVE